MDIWKPIPTSTNGHVTQAAILFDQFHVLVHLGEALDKVRMHGYARLDGNSRTFIKWQKCALLSHLKNLKGPARENL